MIDLYQKDLVKMVKKSIFIRNFQQICKVNNHILSRLSLTIALIWGVFFFFLSIAASERSFLPFFGLCFLVSGSVYLLSKFIVSKHVYLVLPLMYAYLIYCLLLAIYFGIFTPPQSVSVTFICLLVMSPSLIIDKRWRINSIMISSAILFGLASFFYQAALIARMNIINCIVFGILGLVMGQIIYPIQINYIETQRKLTKQRDTDILTSLFNRRKLSDTLDNWDSNYNPHPLTVSIMVDIDHFKQYNDRYGHQRGDVCLKQMGRCFSSFFKPYGLSIFRYGGEEFVALGKEYEYEELRLICQKLLKTVEALQIPFPESPDGILTISIGFAEYNLCHAYDYKDLIDMADQGLYKAKEAGRNRAVGYLD